MKSNALVLCFSIAIFASSNSAMADNNPAPSSIECQLIVVTKEKPSFPNQIFSAPLKAESSHGGQEQTFKVDGNPNEVTIIADGKWIGLSWWKAGELVAEGLFVSSDFSQERVTILYNPKNRSEQVSLGCSMVK